jgi:protein tyrosine phosphatase (PTP) superfamily phosphohydrolase (DUF442 family)
MLAAPSAPERSTPERPALAPALARRRRPLRWLWRLSLVVALIFVGYEVGRRLFGANFHTVIAGRVYRGAQPTPRMVKELAGDYGVRTIINLRGCGLPQDWYDKESRTAQHLGVDLEDICFSPVRLPSSLELRRLVEVLDRAAYPVYLHCRRGADRTGMAAVIVMLLQTDKPLAEARQQLGIRYGHVALGQTRVLDRFIDLYEDWLNKQGRSHDQAAFRHWLMEEYRGGWCSAKFEEFTPLASRAHVGEPIGYRVRVRNTGTDDWQFRAGPQSGMHLAYQVRDGDKIVAEGRAGMFDRKVDPDEAVTITLVVAPLARAGRFRLFVDMVEEQHCWFHQAGSEPVEEELVVAE